MVYFVQADRYRLPGQVEGLIKIGWSTDLARRLTALRREHGPIRVLLEIPGDDKEERRLHERFAHLRVWREWFMPDRSILDLVKERA